MFAFYKHLPDSIKHYNTCTWFLLYLGLLPNISTPTNVKYPFPHVNSMAKSCHFDCHAWRKLLVLLEEWKWINQRIFLMLQHGLLHKISSLPLWKIYCIPVTKGVSISNGLAHWMLANEYYWTRSLSVVGWSTMLYRGCVNFKKHCLSNKLIHLENLW